MRTSTWSVIGAVVLASGTWLFAACNNAQLGDTGAGGSTDAGPGPGPGPAGSTGSQGCVGPLGAPQDPSSLPSCCPDYPGNAACVENVPDQIKNVVAACDTGGFCVPDDFISTGGIYTPATCKSVGGADGVCLSLCVPQVAMYKAALPQDICKDSERCAPCISPLDKMETGACKIGFSCGSMSTGAEMSTSTASGGMTCPHMGPPVIDPSTLPACPMCGDGHCVGAALVPPDEQAKLTMCDANSYCVPDVLIASGGDFIPPTCKSIAGFEGRCLSKCLPDVAMQAAMLPQDICSANEACVPCYNPQDATATGACTTSCDPGPAGPPMKLPTCCNGIGQCIPSASVPPDKAGELGPDTCPMDPSNFLCVPEALIPGQMVQPGDITNQHCTTDFIVQLIFGSDYADGACLPKCIPKVDSAPLIGSGDCGDNNFKCIPCLDPQTGMPSGACP